MLIEGTKSNSKPKQIAVDDDGNLKATLVGSLANIPIEQKGRKLRVGVLKTTYSTQVGAGATSVVSITPTAGHIGKLLTLSFYAPGVVGSTGNHFVYAQIGTFSSDYIAYSMISANGVGTSALTFGASTFVNVKGVVFNADNLLNIAYTAPGANPQTGARAIMAIWEEEAVVS